MNLNSVMVLFIVILNEVRGWLWNEAPYRQEIYGENECIHTNGILDNTHVSIVKNIDVINALNTYTK